MKCDDCGKKERIRNSRYCFGCREHKLMDLKLKPTEKSFIRPSSMREDRTGTKGGY